jgi:hypothetical protein
MTAPLLKDRRPRWPRHSSHWSWAGCCSGCTGEHICPASRWSFLRRRVLCVTLLAWLPLLLLSAVDGNLHGGVRIPFLNDVEAHVRFLAALPLLIVAEVFVHDRITPLIREFVDRRIVSTEDLPAFNEAVRSAMRARDSIVLEAGLLVVVYTLGLWLWRSELALEAATW